MSQDPTDTDEQDTASGQDSGTVRKRVGPKVVNAVRDNVTVELFDVQKLRDSLPRFDDIPSKRDVLRVMGTASIEPDGRFTEHNDIVKPYRELLAELINPNLSTTNQQATHMAFGDDSTATDPSDTHLVNEVYRQQIDDHVTRQADDQYAATVLIQSNDAVGDSLLEAALVNESDPTNQDDMAFNRVLLSDPQNRLDPKSSDFAVTVTIELTFLDESQAA